MKSHMLNGRTQTTQASVVGFPSRLNSHHPQLAPSAICIYRPVALRSEKKPNKEPKTGPLFAHRRRHQQHPLPEDPGWAGGAFKSPAKLLFTYSTCPSLSLGDQSRPQRRGTTCGQKILSALITEGWRVICLSPPPPRPTRCPDQFYWCNTSGGKYNKKLISSLLPLMRGRCRKLVEKSCQRLFESCSLLLGIKNIDYTL